MKSHLHLLLSLLLTLLAMTSAQQIEGTNNGFIHEVLTAMIFSHLPLRNYPTRKSSTSGIQQSLSVICCTHWSIWISESLFTSLRGAQSSFQSETRLDDDGVADVKEPLDMENDQSHWFDFLVTEEPLLVFESVKDLMNEVVSSLCRVIFDPWVSSLNIYKNCFMSNYSMTTNNSRIT